MGRMIGEGWRCFWCGICGVVSSGVASAAAGAAMELVVPGEVHVLAAGDGRVEIVLRPPAWLREWKARFDQSAAVASVRRAGVEFLRPDAGLCDEFGLHGLGVLGFDEAPPGGKFLKIGVGRITRPDGDPYRFWREYPEVQYTEVRRAGDDRRLEVETADALAPWGYRLRKTYELAGAGELVLTLALANTGERSFAFEHYNHHFLQFDGQTDAYGYAVETGFALPELGEAAAAWKAGPHRLAPREPLGGRGAFYWGSDLPIAAAKNWLRVTHAEVPAEVEIEGDSAAHRFAVWTDRTSFCPEIFRRAEIAPGEETVWTLRYRFRLVER
jgi:hypothetical protein